MTANYSIAATKFSGFRALLILSAAMEAVYISIFRLNNLKERVEDYIPLVLLNGLLYLVAVALAERIPQRRSNLVLIFFSALVFRATLFPLYPTLSDDMVRYRWDARAQEAGLNPYLVRPADERLRYLRDETYQAVAGPQYPTLYGPALTAALLASYKLFHGVVAMKIPFLLLDAGIVLLLFRLLPMAGASPAMALVYAWNPLVIVEFAASGHNDTLPIFALLLSILFFKMQKSRWSVASLSLSALSKAFAAFLLPVFIVRLWNRRGWTLAAIPVAMAAIVFAPYGFAIREYLKNLSEYGMHWRNNASLYWLIEWASPNAAIAAKVYLSAIAAAIAYVLYRKLEPERAAFVVLGTVLLFSPNVFPWYFTWMAPLLAIYPSPAWLYLTVAAPLSYHVLIPYRILGRWREEPLYLLLEYVPFFLLFCGSYFLNRAKAGTSITSEPRP